SGDPTIIQYRGPVVCSVILVSLPIHQPWPVARAVRRGAMGSIARFWARKPLLRWRSPLVRACRSGDTKVHIDSGFSWPIKGLSMDRATLIERLQQIVGPDGVF